MLLLVMNKCLAELTPQGQYQEIIESHDLHIHDEHQYTSNCICMYNSLFSKEWYYCYVMLRQCFTTVVYSCDGEKKKPKFSRIHLL